MRPPEYYRKLEQVGVGDANESCIFSLRESMPLEIRPQIDVWVCNSSWEKISPPFKLKFTDLTVYDSSQPMGWLQSWFLIKSVIAEDELDSLKLELAKMQKEFGSYTAIIPGQHFSEFWRLLKKSYKGRLNYGSVKYTSNRLDHNMFCKDISYAYQSEFRIVAGSCPVKHAEDMEFQVVAGFKNIVLPNCCLRLHLSDGEFEYLQLGI